MTTVNDPYLRHLFDGDPMFNVYSKETMNLSVGAPGPEQLKHCIEILKKCTQHRMVINLILYSFIFVSLSDN